MAWFEILSLILLSLILFINAVDGALTKTPSNIFVAVGDTAEFSCSTNITKRTVTWFIAGNLTTDYLLPDHIYLAGKLSSRFSPRFAVSHDSNGNYILSISDVRSTDAGIYGCQDANGFGDKAQAKLLVRVDIREECTPPLDHVELSTVQACKGNEENRSIAVPVVVACIITVVMETTLVAVAFCLQIRPHLVPGSSCLAVRTTEAESHNLLHSGCAGETAVINMHEFPDNSAVVVGAEAEHSSIQVSEASDECCAHTARLGEGEPHAESTKCDGASSDPTCANAGELCLEPDDVLQQPDEIVPHTSIQVCDSFAAPHRQGFRSNETEDTALKCSRMLS